MAKSAVDLKKKTSGRIMGQIIIIVGADPSATKYITQTCPCNILQYFTTVKMIIFS